MSDAGILSSVFVAVMVAFYLMFIRPIHKDQARHRQQIRDLRPGDEVLTTSNFVAKIKDIQVGVDGVTRISLELADGVVFTALPGAILERLGAQSQGAPSETQRESSGPATTSGPGQASA